LSKQPLGPYCLETRRDRLAFPPVNLPIPWPRRRYDDPPLDANSRTALLVDDESASRTAHSARLEGEGYTVFVAQNQADALSRAKQVAPRVIFAHLGRSGLGNLALIQALRSDDSCRHIPVVVVRDQPAVAARPAKLRAVPHDSW
jgi:CheY-like chemotaxis protein